VVDNGQADYSMHDSHSHSFKGQIPAAAILAIFVTLIVMVADYYHVLLEAPDKFIYDWKSSLFSTKIVQQRKDITIVYIDEASLANYPYKSPIDRVLIASLVKAIDRAKPTAIGIDIIFDRSTEPDRDKVLLRTIQQVQAPLVLIGTDKSESGVFREALEWQATFLDEANKTVATPFFGGENAVLTLESALSPDDNVVRTMEPFKASSNVRKPFALALAEQTGNYQYPNSLLIDWLLPSSDGREVFQTFNVPPHSKISVDKVSVDADADAVFPKFMQAAVTNKIVIVAGNLTGSDWHRIPMTVMNNLEVPGAYIHAQILAQILDLKKNKTFFSPPRQITDSPKTFTILVVFVSAFFLYLGIELITEKHPEILFEALIIGSAILFGAFMFCAFRVSFPSAQLLMVWFLVAFFGKYTSNILKGLQKRARHLGG
jgi:CHASE2 domain-containing sensor protein